MYAKQNIREMERLLPSPEETRIKVRTYLDRSGLTMSQFAAMTGYSGPAIHAFLSDKYSQRAGTDAPLRTKLEAAMAKYPVGMPDTDAEGTLYETENVADLRQWFNHCHAHRALAFCYGPPGSQKTFVLKHLVAEFNRRELQRADVAHRAYYIRASIDMRPRDLVIKMCQACGATTGLTLQSCLAGARIELRDTQSLFVVDEAQMLSIKCLEALRELHDEEPQVGILLAGSHNLKRLFDRRASELEQWNSRLDAGIELTGVSEERARAILQTELPNLSPKQVETFLQGAHVPDAYSTTNTSYLNVRRLFKNIDAYREMRQQKGKAA